MTAVQFAVDLHEVVAFDIVVRVGPGHALQAAGGGIRLHVHIDDIGGGKGDVLAALVCALLGQLCPFVHGDCICVVDVGAGVNPQVFGQAAAVALGIVVNVHIRIGGKNLAVFRGHFGIFADIHGGGGGDGLLGINIRRYLDDAAHGHVVVPGPAFVVPVIGAGLHLVLRQHIALPGGQFRALRKLRRRVHRDVVVGVGPGYAEDAARAGGGAAVARHLLQCADVRALCNAPRT